MKHVFWALSLMGLLSCPAPSWAHSLLALRDICEEVAKGARRGEKPLLDRDQQEALAAGLNRDPEEYLPLLVIAYDNYLKGYTHTKYGFVDLDLVQETWRKVFRAYTEKRSSRYDGRRDSQIQTWLVKILVNQGTDEARKRQHVDKHRDEVIQEEKERIANGEAPEASSPTSAGDLEYLKERMDRAISQLPEKHQRVFLMFMVDGKSHKEISLETGYPMGTVSTVIAEAKERLAIKLKEVREEFYDP